MTEQNEQLLRFYRAVREQHRAAFSLLGDVQAACRQGNTPSPVVDAILLLKKTNNYVDDMRKEINRALELLQRLGCLHAAHTDDNSLRGEIASGFGSSSMQALLPDREKDPASYDELMSALGFENAPPTIKPSYSGVEAHVTALLSEGKQLPKGLAHCRQVPKFTVNVRAKSGVDLDALADGCRLELEEENPF